MNESFLLGLLKKKAQFCVTLKPVPRRNVFLSPSFCSVR